MRTYRQKHKDIKYSDHWGTPENIYNQYTNEMGYYDPCPLHGDDFDFSVIDEPIFLNPPYSDVSTWVKWAINNHVVTGKPIVILLPSRTDTKYFHEILEYGCDLEFIKGRLKFGGQKGTAPFPSVLIHLKGG